LNGMSLQCRNEFIQGASGMADGVERCHDFISRRRHGNLNQEWFIPQ
jgi:hypothetical protein